MNAGEGRGHHSSQGGRDKLSSTEGAEGHRVTEREAGRRGTGSCGSRRLSWHGFQPTCLLLERPACPGVMGLSLLATFQVQAQLSPPVQARPILFHPVWLQSPPILRRACCAVAPRQSPLVHQGSAPSLALHGAQGSGSSRTPPQAQAAGTSVSFPQLHSTGVMARALKP